MGELTNEPVTSGQSQAIGADVNLPPHEADKTAASAVIIVNNSTLLTEPEQTNPPPNEISLPEKDEPQDITALTPAKESIPIQTQRQTVSILVMQIVLLGVMGGITVGYGWFHNVPHAFTVMFSDKGIEDFHEAIAHYNFVGVSPENPEPSFFSVMIEAGIWSLFGVLARSEYYLTQIVMGRKELRLLEAISKLIGDTAMGVAIAMAVVAFLRSTELVNLTLKTADIGAIGAISFVLGFYHEDTRRLLGSFRSTISGGNAKESKNDE
jgi:hypothetical protein